MATRRSIQNEFLLREFDRSLSPLWLKTWRGIVRDAIAVHAATLIDIQKGDLIPGWENLDDAKRRARLKTSNKETWAECVNLLMMKESRSKILAAFESETGHKPNATPLRNALDAVMPALLAKPATKAVTSENPFPTIWPEVANEIAKIIYNRKIPRTPDREWEYLNGLLIAAFISGSRLPMAKHVVQVFASTRNKLISVRGSFVRIPELVYETGILDVTIEPINRTGGVTLQHESLTPLLAATADQSRKILLGQGVFHERLGTTGATSVPPEDWGGSEGANSCGEGALALSSTNTQS